MKITVQKIPGEQEEAVFVQCHDPESEWVANVQGAAEGQRCVCAYQGDDLHRLRLSDIFYFEVVDNASFIYTRRDVFSTHLKLYEFEALSARSSLFRCSKSMILNADRIDYVRPSLSGRYEAVLSNGEAVTISRKYVVELKRLLGM